MICYSYSGPSMQHNNSFKYHVGLIMVLKTDYINAIYSARHVNNAFSCIMCACCAHFLIVVNICIYKYYDVFALSFRCEYNIYVLLHAHSYIIIIYYQLKELRIQFT